MGTDHRFMLSMRELTGVGLAGAGSRGTMILMIRHGILAQHSDAAPARAEMCCRMLERDAATD